MASKRCKKAKLLAHRAQHRSFMTERLKTTTKESTESVSYHHQKQLTVVTAIL